MKKLTQALALLSVTLACGALHNAMANPPADEHKATIEKGKEQRQEGMKDVHESAELRKTGHEKIKQGKEMIHAGEKEKGKAMIKSGRDDVRRANQLHHEGKKEVRKGNQDVYKGYKNIRERERR